MKFSLFLALFTLNDKKRWQREKNCRKFYFFFQFSTTFASELKLSGNNEKFRWLIFKWLLLGADLKRKTKRNTEMWPKCVIYFDKWKYLSLFMWIELSENSTGKMRFLLFFSDHFHFRVAKKVNDFYELTLLFPIGSRKNSIKSFSTQASNDVKESF